MRQFGGCVPGQKLKTKLIENTLTLQLPANSWLPDWSVEYPTPTQVKYICLIILYIGTSNKGDPTPLYRCLDTTSLPQPSQ